jgi:hypothetical protein
MKTGQLQNPLGIGYPAQEQIGVAGSEHKIRLLATLRGKPRDSYSKGIPLPTGR